MGKEDGESRVLKAMPKGLTNHLNLIKKNKEVEDLKQKQVSGARGSFQLDTSECTLQSDKILLKQEAASRNNRSRAWSGDFDDDSQDKWQKLPDKTKPIKKISLASLKDQSRQNNQELDRNSPVVQKPKKKITIQRDSSGKVRFEEEIIGNSVQRVSAKSSSNNNNNSRVGHQSVAQQQGDDDNDYDSLDDEDQQQYQQQQQYERRSSDDYRERDSSSPPRRSQNKGGKNHSESNNTTTRKLEIKKVAALAPAKSTTAATTTSQSSSSRPGYIQVENLPHQIDNQFLNDLLKKEKDSIIDSYKIDDLGRVKFTSKEAAERAISILNKRTLYGNQVSAYVIQADEFDKQPKEDISLSHRIIKSRK